MKHEPIIDPSFLNKHVSGIVGKQKLTFYVFQDYKKLLQVFVSKSLVVFLVTSRIRRIEIEESVNGVTLLNYLDGVPL